MYRLFIDETGHDHLKSSNTPQEQYLCLMGVILNGGGHWDLRRRMDALKMSIFGRTDVVLHRREIINKTPPFDVLKDDAIRGSFDCGMLGMIRDSTYTAIAAMIDKQAHIAKYQVWQYQPYHYCLAVMMERYVMWLKERNGRGDVLAEWRGINQNMKLERSYNGLFRKGTDNVSAAEMQTYLTSSQIKIEKKEANIAGLQLADLIASPARTHLVCEIKQEKMKAPFGQEIAKILLDDKFRRSPSGTIAGYGVKTLP